MSLGGRVAGRQCGRREAAQTPSSQLGQRLRARARALTSSTADNDNLSAGLSPSRPDPRYRFPAARMNRRAYRERQANTAAIAERLAAAARGEEVSWDSDDVESATSSQQSGEGFFEEAHPDLGSDTGSEGNMDDEDEDEGKLGSRDGSLTGGRRCGLSHSSSSLPSVVLTCPRPQLCPHSGRVDRSRSSTMQSTCRATARKPGSTGASRRRHHYRHWR